VKIISKKEAKALGLKKYFTGEPCKHGHICERYTSSMLCIECRGPRTKEKDRMKWRRAHDPEYRERNNKRKKVTPEQRLRNRARWRWRYVHDLEFRARQIERSRRRNRARDKEKFNLRRRLRGRTHNEKARNCARLAARYASDPEFRNARKMQARKSQSLDYQIDLILREAAEIEVAIQQQPQTAPNGGCQL